MTKKLFKFNYDNSYRTFTFCYCQFSHYWENFKQRLLNFPNAQNNGVTIYSNPRIGCGKSKSR